MTSRRRAIVGAVAVLLLGLALGPPAPPRAHADGFLAALDDVPLMPGLAERVEDGVSFEAATGRIVEAVAQGRRGPRLDRARVVAFYGEVLPGLGWRRTGETRFVREGEVLVLAVDETPGRVLVRFALRPR
ncbi:MAG TPA: hypothetical protein VGC25_08955 [Alphaproteobacteria bacterium]|jgi:hypothetical protein